MRIFVFSFLLISAPAAAQVGVTHALDKIRPDAAVPSLGTANIDAASNEVEPFQIVIGPSTNVAATASDLVGPGTIAASNVRLYREGLYDVAVASNSEGATGMWPDPLIPAVDLYANEARNAFPFDVPGGEVRAIWVDVYVPNDTPPGNYTGTIAITTDAQSYDVPIALHVRGFSLPSTSSLPSAFGMGWADACIAHRGSYEACGDSGVEEFHVLYARAALSHRVSIESVVYAPPRDDAGWSHFHSVYGGLLRGTEETRYPGARPTTIRALGGDVDEMLRWRTEFGNRGYDAILFDYTCDEPPNGCAFSEITTRAEAARGAGVPVLVTTDIDGATDNDLLGTIDILTPVVNFMHDRGGSDRRAEYDAWLADPTKRLWWYQSCMSHGCGTDCSATTDDYFTGWPSMMIDASGVQNRAMEWLSFRYRISGELYFQTTHALPTAWTDQCDFSGNGDGTLFYPGRPDLIGGVTDIPIESIRLKLIREGMEDYEYLRLLSELGDPALAEMEATTLFPTPYAPGTTNAEDLYEARARIADRIEELLVITPMIDAGASDVDAGTTMDAGPDPDLVTGCGPCRAAPTHGTPTTVFVFGIALAILAVRRR